MVRDPTTFTAAPFSTAVDPATFHAGRPQEEALARLEWLAEARERFGLVVAAEGHGKSHLAAMAVRRLGGLGAEVALLSLRGLAEGDWIELLLERLPLDSMSRAEPLRPWQKLENRLRENTLMERTTALVFDDTDHAPRDAIDGIVRLATAVEPRYGRLAVIATTTPAGAARLPEGLRQRAAVRIELSAWEADDVAAYLAGGLERVGGDAGTFTPEAAETLARFAGGAPRTVAQLAQLALLAAAGDGLARVDAATVERAWRELIPGSREPPPTADPIATRADPADEQPHTAANPRVRVVRRLWG